jgi:hypothetical protein
MVRMMCAYGEGPVKLLRGNYSCEFVGKGDAAKRNRPVGSGARFGRPAVSWSNGQNELLCAIVLKETKGIGYFFGGKILAKTVGKEEDGTGAAAGGGDKIEKLDLGGKNAENTGNIVSSPVKIELNKFSDGTGGARTMRGDERKLNFHRTTRRYSRIILLIFIVLYSKRYSKTRRIMFLLSYPSHSSMLTILALQMHNCLQGMECLTN